MIPVKREEWRGQQNGKDRGMLWMVEPFSLLSLKVHFDLSNSVLIFAWIIFYFETKRGYDACSSVLIREHKSPFLFV